jgi:hypothetical protein
MACEYYKNCYAYDSEKDVCMNNGNCKVYDEFNIVRDRRASLMPTHNPERITTTTGLEIIAIDESIKQKQRNVSTKK